MWKSLVRFFQLNRLVTSEFLNEFIFLDYANARSLHFNYIFIGLNHLNLISLIVLGPIMLIYQEVKAKKNIFSFLREKNASVINA